MSPGAEPGGPETILVVDDIAANRLVASGFLTDDGYRVREAAGGAEALAIVGRERVDLVLLDIRMPDMDGFETCRRLRACPDLGTVPIVFLTAVADLRAQEQAIGCGADDFLAKPIQRVELLLRVRSLLRIKRLHAELEQANALLRAQRDALVDAALARTRIAAMIVHDLKSPLASLAGNARYVLDTPGLPQEARAAVHDMLAVSERMHRMVLDLLDFSRGHETRLVPRCAPFDVAALFEECRATFRRAAEERAVSLVLEAAASVELRADRDLVRRVLENLLDNALGHAPAGSVVRLCAEREPAGVSIAVVDEGAGIPDEHKAAVFDPYVQLKGGPPRRASRGLGLAFCRLAVEAHGGRITVTDAAPRGTAFRVWLPHAPNAR